MAKKKKEEKIPEFSRSCLGNPVLNYGIYYMSKGEKTLFTLAVFVIGGLVGLIFYGGLFKADGERTLATMISNVVVFLLIGFIAWKIFFPAINQSLKNKRDNKLRKQFLNLMETLVASLSSGNTVLESFRNARSDLLNQYSEKDYIICELTEILSGVDNGQAIESMLQDFGERSGNEDIQNFANVIGNCYRMGGDFKDVVRKTRDVIADKMAIEDEIETKLSSNKLQLNAMCLMPIALVGLLKVTNESFASNLSSVVGVLVTTVAVVLFLVAYFWGQKIIDVR